MTSVIRTLRNVSIGAIVAAAFTVGTAATAGPQIVAGPGADPECFKPQSADTKYF